jgi:hypothetical protein
MPFLSHLAEAVMYFHCLDRVISALDNQKLPTNIFLDLTKAFDTINHNILLSKLKYYGIRNKSLELLNSYIKPISHIGDTVEDSWRFSDWTIVYHS